jgi:hypothetical protein
METNFVHADEAETSLGLLLFPEGMMDMSAVVDGKGKTICRMGTLICLLNRIKEVIDGQREKAILQLKLRQRHMDLLVNQAYLKLKKQSALLRRYSDI